MPCYRSRWFLLKFRRAVACYSLPPAVALRRRLSAFHITQSNSSQFQRITVEERGKDALPHIAAFTENIRLPGKTSRLIVKRTSTVDTAKTLLVPGPRNF